jgi:hypothetical protein
VAAVPAIVLTLGIYAGLETRPWIAVFGLYVGATGLAVAANLIFAVWISFDAFLTVYVWMSYAAFVALCLGTLLLWGAAAWDWRKNVGRDLFHYVGLVALTTIVALQGFDVVQAWFFGWPVLWV